MKIAIAIALLILAPSAGTAATITIYTKLRPEPVYLYAKCVAIFVGHLFFCSWCLGAGHNVFESGVATAIAALTGAMGMSFAPLFGLAWISMAAFALAAQICFACLFPMSYEHQPPTDGDPRKKWRH